MFPTPEHTAFGTTWAPRPAGSGGRAVKPACWRALAVCLGLITVGCSSDDRIATHPVRGRVSVGGEPASGAFIVFHPAAALPDDVARPTAQVRPDGSFELTTFDESDGAPAGDYAVTVEWRKLVKAGGEVQAGPNVVPNEYAKPESTPLKVTISEGDNDLSPFDIQSRRR